MRCKCSGIRVSGVCFEVCCLECSQAFAGVLFSLALSYNRLVFTTADLQDIGQALQSRASFPRAVRECQILISWQAQHFERFAFRPTQSAQRVHFACALHSQKVHRATARAIRPTQSAQGVCFAFSKSAQCHSESDSTHPQCCACHDIGTQARKYCASTKAA